MKFRFTDFSYINSVHSDLSQSRSALYRQQVFRKKAVDEGEAHNSSPVHFSQ